jgi:hypothetical protein
VAFPRQPVGRLEIVNTSQSSVLHVRALNLIDDGRQMAFPITPDSRVERVDFFDLKLYDRQDALPRAYLAGRSQVLDDAAVAARLSAPDFEPRAEVALASSATARELQAAPDTGSVAFEIDRPEQVRLAVRTDAERYLVLSDSWYPGWTATIDGIAVPIERANILFRAVTVPPGAHVVEFRYEPRSVQIGAMLSAGGLAVAAVLVAGAFAWSRRRGDGGAS